MILWQLLFVLTVANSQILTVELVLCLDVPRSATTYWWTTLNQLNLTTHAQGPIKPGNHKLAYEDVSANAWYAARDSSTVRLALP